MKRFLTKTGKVVNEVVITSASVAAGTTVGLYALEHDVCNDEELSTIVAATAGTATTMIASLVCREVEYIAVSTVVAVKNMLKKKNKDN